MIRRGPLNVVVTGVTVSGNMGGTAMLITAMQEIARRAPGSRFTLLSYTPKADRAASAIPELTIVSADYRFLVLLYLPLAFLLYPFLRAGVVRRLVGTVPYFRALDEADLVVDLCGIAFSDGRGLPLLAYNVACVLPALAMRRPVAKLAQALGPFRKPLNRVLARFVLSRCAIVIARGARSFSFLQELGLKNIACRPDVTFAMRVDEEARAEARALLASKGVPGDALVVSPSEVVRRLCAAEGIDFEAEMQAFIERVRADGTPVLILPHSMATDGSKNDDIALCRRLHARFATDAGVAIIDDRQDPIVLRAIIGECAVHVGCRFHGVVGALAMGVPTLIIGWSHKYREMSEPLQPERWAMDWRGFSAERAHTLFRALVAERDATAASIAEGLPALKREASENFDLALDVASRRKAA